MANPEGSFIWYELMTPDPDGAKAFYDAVIGWTVEERPAGPMDYRMIAAGDGNVGGVMRLDDQMLAGGARPAWFGYLGVRDVDAKVGAIEADGGTVMIPPTDIPDVGRFALVTDPAGVPFYVMTTISDETSQVYARWSKLGHVSWNELVTPDQDSALGFYGRHFGIEKSGSMDMGAMGEYMFIAHAGGPIGAVWKAQDGAMRPAWTFYFRVGDLDAAMAAIAAGGGRVLNGPHTVPTGERVLLAIDPRGAVFGLAAGGEQPA